MTRSTVQPLVYSVGIGEILTGFHIDMRTGEIVIFILKNKNVFEKKTFKCILKEMLVLNVKASTSYY